jgi:hypothetical protein
MTPDGGAVTVDRSGTMRDVPVPVPEVPDAGVGPVPEGVVAPAESEHH